MKLKTFNIKTAPASRAKAASVRINAKAGLFNFSKDAFDLMVLKPGDQIQVHQDESAPDCFYLEQVKEDGFVLREKTGAGAASGGGIFNSTTVAREIQSAHAIPENAFKMLIAGKPTEEAKRKLWGLLRIGV